MISLNWIYNELNKEYNQEFTDKISENKKYIDSN